MPENLGFDLGRSDGFPSRYRDQFTAARVDVLVAGLITAFLILAIALFAIIPAYNSVMRKVLFCRIFCSLFIGGVILVGNYGHHWEKGVIKMSAPYKPGIADEIQGELGLHIALRGINITLTGKPADHASSENHKSNSSPSPLSTETINYNEHFSWEWAQGRFGFGKYAGRISRDFRTAVLEGVPLPILQVAEYFTFDGEGIRFGRYYRLAGWYTHLILWFAFGTWLISNILFCMVIRTAALYLFITGCLQLSAIAVWTCIRNFIELNIPFQTYDGKGEIILHTHFCVDYYLVLANGLFCLFLSGLITILDALMPDEMCHYFGIDPLTIYDELLLTKDEIKEEKKRMSKLMGDKSNDIEMDPTGMMNLNVDEHKEAHVFLRKRSNKADHFVNQIKPRVPRRTKATSGESLSDKRVRQPLLQPHSSDEETRPSESWPPPPNSKYTSPTPPPKPKSLN